MIDECRDMIDDLRPGDLIEVMWDSHLWSVSAFGEGWTSLMRPLCKGERAIVVAVKLDGRLPADVLVLTSNGMGWTDISIWRRNST